MGISAQNLNIRALKEKLDRLFMVWLEQWLPTADLGAESAPEIAILAFKVASKPQKSCELLIKCLPSLKTINYHPLEIMWQTTLIPIQMFKSKLQSNTIYS